MREGEAAYRFVAMAIAVQQSVAVSENCCGFLLTPREGLLMRVCCLMLPLNCASLFITARKNHAKTYHSISIFFRLA